MKFKDFLKKIYYFVSDFKPFLYRPEYKIHNHRFEIHKTDKDIWPSYPHIHFLEDDIKMNIYSGELYRIQTKREINEASDNDMKKLWNDKKFLEVVIDCRKNKPINVKELEDLPYKWIDEETREWIEKYESNNK